MMRQAPKKLRWIRNVEAFSEGKWIENQKRNVKLTKDFGVLQRFWK